MTSGRVVLVVAFLGLGYVYASALLGGTWYASQIPIPAAWIGVFSNRIIGVLAWMIAIQMLAVVVLSVPFAYLIGRIGAGYGPVIALAMTLAIFFVFSWSSFLTLFNQPLPTSTRIVTAFDQTKFIWVLPLLVWLLRKLPSNNRWRGP